MTKTSHVTDVVKAEKIKLTEKEIFRMENAADKLELSTVRYWEKIME